MDFYKWGDVIIHKDENAFVKRMKRNNEPSLAIYYIKIFDDHLETKLIQDKQELISFKDVKKYRDANLNSFTRYIKDSIYYFEDGELTLITEKKK